MARLRCSGFAAAAAHHMKFSSALMAVTKNCLAQNNMSTSFQHIAVLTCGQWSGCKALNRQTDETHSHQCHFKDGEWNIDIDLVPKKLGLQDKDCNRNLGFLSSLARHPALQRAATSSFHFQLKFRWKKGRNALELPLVRG